MLDYYENGKWIATELTNYGGMREAYDVELTNEDLPILELEKN